MPLISVHHRLFLEHSILGQELGAVFGKEYVVFWVIRIVSLNGSELVFVLAEVATLKLVMDFQDNVASLNVI